MKLQLLEEGLQGGEQQPTGRCWGSWLHGMVRMEGRKRDVPAQHVLIYGSGPGHILSLWEGGF